MNQKSNKLPMKSTDLTADHIEQIGSLFPQVLVEIPGEDGTIRHGIDFDLLRQELAGDVIEGREERYEFTWVGKRRSIIEANRPVQKTLRPYVKESKDWESTKNIFIEGDNLDALKLLQESYLNAVKMIYIDPPYNTGNDFIYNDTFVMDSEEYDEETEVVDEAGNRMFKNGKDRGRYHSDWCSMLYPRLKLAKNLLRDDGVIFVSIDDNEVHNLRKMMDEVFGEENFVGIIIWQKRKGGGNDSKYLGVDHEYIVIFVKNIQTCNKKWRIPYSDEYLTRYREIDEKGRYYWDTLHRGGLKNPIIFDVECPDGSWIKDGSWQISEKTFLELKSKGEIRISKGKNNDWTVQHKVYLPEGRVFRSIYSNYSNADSSKEIDNIFLDPKIFTNPKPVGLISDIFSLNENDENIILDFFAGSCSSAQSIMELNNSDNNHSRKYIMVQLPELCSENSEAFKAGFKTIADIGKERIRRAGEIIKKEIEQENAQSTLTGSPKPIPDIGFRVFKVDDTNMKDVYYSATEYKQETIEGLIDNVKDDRNDLDLLYQVLLSWGLKLDLTHTTEKIDNITIHHIDPENHSLIACFDSNIPEEVMRKIALMKPLRAVFRDGSFKDSPGKLNIDGIFKTLSPNTTVRVI